ncbi:hypothetical protein [Parasedimentitalea maritima]|uniref:hypothetical protein n=1 Tax=Parasedimentitalea maritima TaxID=2578117 RepID=UPI001BB2A4DF|nr:hypothetical protein [Zongyanglinia marina]
MASLAEFTVAHVIYLQPVSERVSAMFRFVLPVAVCLFGQSSVAQEVSDAPLVASENVGSECVNIVGSQKNCVRVLACIGESGLYFDGVALGWDAGRLKGLTSAGAQCDGWWTTGGILGTGTAKLRCTDGMIADVFFYSQDNLTGTVIGRGKDSENRILHVWSGKNVLQFLTGPNGQPRMECGAVEVLIG